MFLFKKRGFYVIYSDMFFKHFLVYVEFLYLIMLNTNLQKSIAVVLYSYLVITCCCITAGLFRVILHQVVN